MQLRPLDFVPATCPKCGAPTLKKFHLGDMQAFCMGECHQPVTLVLSEVMIFEPVEIEVEEEAKGPGE